LRGTKFKLPLHLNGKHYVVIARAADTLLDVLRNHLGQTGAKPSCENGDCGACTVLVDGTPYKSCIMLAAEAEGHRITTIEGLHHSPIQEAFVACQAFQCGYCTPGFIMNCHALLSQGQVNDKTIQDWLESNICRCLGYEEIEAAVKSVMHRPHDGDD
jgi:aerobic carbon-monoxide dehydrogenase small subunit